MHFVVVVVVDDRRFYQATSSIDHPSQQIARSNNHLSALRNPPARQDRLFPRDDSTGESTASFRGRLDTSVKTSGSRSLTAHDGIHQQLIFSFPYVPAFMVMEDHAATGLAKRLSVNAIFMVGGAGCEEIQRAWTVRLHLRRSPC
jgi:hypothetical protein